MAFLKMAFLKSRLIMDKIVPARRFDIYRRILGYLRSYKREFVWALVAMVVYGATDGLVPFLIKHVLDGVFSRQNINLLYLLPVVLIIFACVRAISDFGQQFLMAGVGHKIVRDVRNELNEKFLSLGPDYFLYNSSGNLLARITSDVILVRTLLTDSVAAVIRDSIRIVALAVAALYLDPTLAVVAILAFPVGVLPVYRFGRKIRRLSKKGQEAIGSLSSLLQESIVGNRVVKIFGRESFEKEKFAGRNEVLTETFIRSEKFRALTGPLNEVLASVAVSAVILYGGYSVIGGLRTQGDFIAFLVAVFLLYDPFKKLSRVHANIQQGISGAERIFEVLDAKSKIVEPANPLPFGSDYEIEFEEVSFSYLGLAGATARAPALSNISFRIEQGKKVALVGFSGAGKSTLVDLVARFIDPVSGVVKIGGVDISKVSLKELRSKIAIVSQHTFLFNDTICNNILYGREGATRDEVTEAARAAYALEFILALPQGFDTQIGEGGHSLSGGERQRIAIARAILKNAPILVLDEATASLDNKSEREVQLALEVLEQNRTTIVVAHRLSTIRDADRIIVLKEGRIVETGTYDDLLEQGDEFAKLHALQFIKPNSVRPLRRGLTEEMRPVASVINGAREKTRLV